MATASTTPEGAAGRGALRLLLRGRHDGPSTYRVTRWLFLRLLGLVYLIAFVSYWVQIDGLIGSSGILPAADYLQRVGEALGPARFWRVPTLCWIDPSDGFLHGLCAAGALLSLALVAGVAALPALGLLWAIYLSLVVVGQTFFTFQWDNLLLETGFASLFFAPPGLRPRRPTAEGEPSCGGLWVLRCLLFKLMFLSGVTKLLSLDETWWSLTALDYHYYTQPIPSWTSWYAQLLPAGAQRFSVLVMFAIELGAPLLVFLPRAPRMLGGIALIVLQGLIAATGSYGFFNLLSVVLCVPLFDDAFLVGLVPRRWRMRLASAAPDRRARGLALARKAPAALGVAMLLYASSLAFVQEMVRTYPLQTRQGAGGKLLAWGRAYTGRGEWLLGLVGPFRTISGYGLFRSMTRARPEITVEGSDDGRTWEEYEFRWKPGDIRRRPRFVAPHMPRLDWQMWFAALNPGRAGPWLEGLMLRLLEGSPALVRLLDDHPFRDKPPRFVRLVYYDYRFTTPHEARAEGAWWKRRRRAELTEPLSLANFRR